MAAATAPAPNTCLCSNSSSTGVESWQCLGGSGCAACRRHRQMHGSRRGAPRPCRAGVFGWRAGGCRRAVLPCCCGLSVRLLTGARGGWLTCLHLLAWFHSPLDTQWPSQLQRNCMNSAKPSVPIGNGVASERACLPVPDW